MVGATLFGISVKKSAWHPALVTLKHFLGLRSVHFGAVMNYCKSIVTFARHRSADAQIKTLLIAVDNVKDTIAFKFGAHGTPVDGALWNSVLGQAIDFATTPSQRGRSAWEKSQKAWVVVGRIIGHMHSLD